MMGLVNKAEKALESPLASVPPLPKDAKKFLASVFPWLALIGGVLQLLGAWWLYDGARRADELIDALNRWAGAYGYNEGLTAWVWLAVVFLIVDGVILLMAFPKLQKKVKAGWDLLLLASLINVVYGVVSLFIDGRGGIANLLWTLAWSFVGLYLLFQVREFFGGKALKSKS